MAQKPLQLVNGKIAQVSPVTISAGAADSGKIPALDSTGHFDPTLMPPGFGTSTKAIVASEAIGAGDYVNIWDDAGTPKVRLADNSNSREVHGFLLAACASAGTATVYFEGTNNVLSGLTTGARYFLGEAGAPTATPPTFASGAQISQLVGTAISTTEIDTDIDDIVVLA